MEMEPTVEPLRSVFHLSSLATLLCLTSFIALPLPSSTLSYQLQTSKLCAPAPSPASCLAIVSKATLIHENRQPSPAQVLTTILNETLDQMNAADTMASYIYNQNNETQQRAAVADCKHLMDLSRDHVSNAGLAVNKGAWTDARTWMSAVLTYHTTCLDGLDGPAKSAMQSILEGLMALATTSLSVLKAISPHSDDVIEKPVVGSPPWLLHHEKIFLERPLENTVEPNVVVAADGTGNYTTVQEAVASAPDNNDERYVIYVKKGVYREIVRIGKNKKNLMIIGDGLDSTTITGSLANFLDITQMQSATMSSDGAGLILRDLRIENTAGLGAGRGVALRVAGDRSVIHRCHIDGYQDTLYVPSNRQFYRDCWISGTMDFIFGNAAVVFQNCSIIARKPQKHAWNAITAQKRDNPLDNTGMSIQKCRVLPSDDLRPIMHSVKTYLGRPWGVYARVVYMQSFLDGHIYPGGWRYWRAKNDTLYYGEYKNDGPGAKTHGRVTWPGHHVITNPKEVEKFTVAQLIDGGTWLQGAGVPFDEGL